MIVDSSWKDLIRWPQTNNLVLQNQVIYKVDWVRGFRPFLNWLFRWKINGFRLESVVHCQVTRVACFFFCMVKVWEREREREREREEAGKVTLELPFPGSLEKMMNSIQMTNSIQTTCYLIFFFTWRWPKWRCFGQNVAKTHRFI